MKDEATKKPVANKPLKEVASKGRRGSGPVSQSRQAGSANPAKLDDRMRALLVDGAGSLGIALDDRALERFDLYLRVLVDWNSRQNLTAIQSPREIVIRHFLDSLTCAAAYDFALPRPVLDVGAGAGFPGLALKIALPQLSMTLLDGSIKKVEFLRHVGRELGFGDMDVAYGRAEELGHAGVYRQKFYCVVSRGLAALPVLAELCLPFVTVGGYLLAQKNREIEKELAESHEAIPALGGGDPELIDVITPGTDLQRVIVRIRKEQPTPGSFPRRPGVPSRRPLGSPSAPTYRKHEKYS